MTKTMTTSDEAPTIDIYSKFTCPFCVRAKRLLSSKGAEFNEFDITMGGPKRDEMLERAPGARTVPKRRASLTLCSLPNSAHAQDRYSTNEFRN